MGFFRDIPYFIRISRPLNIVISLISFFVSCFIAANHQWHFISDQNFWATSLTILMIAATGYWINDVYDFRIDRINKPEKTYVNAILSVKKVLSVYFVINGLILLFSLYFFVFRQPLYQISFINVVSIVLLFWYASFLKRKGVPGNLLISFLIALVTLLAGYLYGINTPLILTIIFAFQITLIREITKDVEDIRGDLSFQLQTLPIQIGIRGTKKVLSVLYIIFILSTWLPAVDHYLKHDKDILWPYIIASILLVQIPAIFLFIFLQNSVKPETFGKQSTYLKILMLTGIITILLI